MAFALKREKHKSRENHISETMALFPPNQMKNIFYFRQKEKTTNQEKMSSCLQSMSAYHDRETKSEL